MPRIGCGTSLKPKAVLKFSVDPQLSLMSELGMVRVRVPDHAVANGFDHEALSNGFVFGAVSL